MATFKPTFQTVSSELAKEVKKISHLLQVRPRNTEEVTSSAKNLLFGVKGIRELVTTLVAVPAIKESASGPKLIPQYKALGAAVSRMITIGREGENAPDLANSVGAATSAIVAALRGLLELIPKPFHSIPSECYLETSRRRKSRSLPVALSTDEPSNNTTTNTQPKWTRPAAMTSAPSVSPRGDFQRSMTRLSQMLDSEINLITNDMNGLASPRRPDATSSSSSTSSSTSQQGVGSAHISVVEPTTAAVAVLERQLQEAQEKARRASARARAMAVETDELLAEAKRKMEEKEGKLMAIQREFKAFKHASKAPMSDAVTALQQHLVAKDGAEAALEKLHQEHQEMIEVVNSALQEKERELNLLRALVLEPALQGWMSKQGGGKISSAWKDRFFVLRNGMLSYFQNEDDEKPAGVVYLEDAIEAVKSKHKEYSFELKTPNRVFVIAADSKTQMDCWMDKLNELISKIDVLKKNSVSNNAAPVTVESLWRQRQIERTKQQLASRNL